MAAHVIQTDPAGTVAALADVLVARAADAVQQRGVCHIALSGGSTPEQLYRLLASTEWSVRFQWPAIQLWLGDERCVPADHAESNYRMVQSSLIDRMGSNAPPLHRVRTELGAEAAAVDYQRRLLAHLPASQHIPRFDIILLGLGMDGHTASLFPDTAVLHERERLVSAVASPQLARARITFTYPLINAGRAVYFLVTGAEKAPVVAQLLGPSAINTRFPAAHIAPAGELCWYLDQPAASELPS